MTDYVIDMSGDGADDDRPYPIDNTYDIDDWFDRMMMSVADSGIPMSVELGPAGHKPVLLFGLDAVDKSTIHAMIRWLPTGEYGYHPDTPRLDTEVAFDGRFIVTVNDVLAYAPDATQVSGQLVMDAVREYLRTGTRPTVLRWRPAHPAIRHVA